MSLFISKEMYKDLKSLGYNTKNLDGYDTPLYQQVIDYFRIKHKKTFSPIRDGGYWIIRMYDFRYEDESSPMNSEFVTVYEEDYYDAVNETIRQAIEKLKKEKGK